MNAMQDELMQIQLKYQREIERLERENKELRKQILLRGNQKFNTKKIKVSKSHIYVLTCIYSYLSYFDCICKIILIFIEIINRYV